MKKLRFFKDYLIAEYGHALQRVAVDTQLSCPNRLNNGRGCIFCAEDGARAVHLKGHMDLKAQVGSGIDFVRKRYNAKAPYIAYLQSFSNTFAPVSRLRELYLQVLDCADFAILIIATRPDCLPDEVLDLLEELNRKYEVIVELGVQTSNDNTLQLVNRGHNFDCSAQAAVRLAQRGIKCAAHMILGLPGENEKDFLQSARDIASLPFFAVKMHQLLLLKNSQLATIFSDKVKYRNFPDIEFFDDYSYAVQLLKFLEILPDSWAIMRLWADADRNRIILPKRQMKKAQFLEYFKKLWNEVQEQGHKALDFAKVATADGSYTLYNVKYRQHFHSLAGARSEALNKFIVPSKLQVRLNEEPQTLLDVGFGLGYNVIYAALAAEETKAHKLRIVSLENDPGIPRLSTMVFAAGSRERRIIDALTANNHWAGEYSSIELIHGDARNTVRKLGGKFDIVFMDGFSPDKNPQLWTFDFVRELAGRLSENGIIASYCSACSFRGALFRAGLFLGESVPFGRKRAGTLASFNAQAIDTPLNAKELAIIAKSTAGLAYRDLSLAATRPEIIARRRMLLQKMRRRGVPKWIKSN